MGEVRNTYKILVGNLIAVWGRLNSWRLCHLPGSEQSRASNVWSSTRRWKRREGKKV